MARDVSELTQVLRNSASGYLEYDPVVPRGLLAYEDDTGKIKLGDGTSKYSQLSYVANGGGGGESNATSQLIIDNETPINKDSTAAMVIAGGLVAIQDPTEAGQQVIIQVSSVGATTLTGNLDALSGNEVVLNQYVTIASAIDFTDLGGQPGLSWRLTPVIGGDTAIVNSINGLQGEVSFTADDLGLAPVASSGNYDDLSGLPEIPDITGLATETYVDDEILLNGSSGRELAYASNTTTQTGIAGTATDVTNLSITFDVGSRPVYVEAQLPYVFAVTAAAGANMLITDAANTTRSLAGMNFDAASSGGILRAVERISTPGTYTRKVRVIRSAGTGTISIGFNANSVSSIRAVEA